MPAAVPPVTPAQLPPALPGFVGRIKYLRQLDAILTDDPIPITAITGTAGVGKTSLAIHWAHRVRHHFPDGQLYLNLRGFDPNGASATPADALRDLLDGLRVPPHAIPATLQAQIGLYRTLLADKRVLIVLDNALDAEQVRPLLPGSPGCLAVVTSRNPLSSLVAIEGARLLHLDLLSTAEARDLLVHRLGSGPVTADQEATHQIIDACVHLPLALAIAASRAATSPGLSVKTLATELRGASDQLDGFDLADAPNQIRAVFDASYRALSPDAAG